MREAGVQVRHREKYKVTTDSHHKQPVFENKLNRQFDVAKPDQVYVSDITDIWNQEGWLYLAVVIDLFSRKVVGWSMSSRMKAKLVYDALQMVVWQCQPQVGLTVHSDRGSQYACKQYRQLLKIYGFIGSLKQEQIHWQYYLTRYAAQQDVLHIFPCFITASDYIHTWDTKAQTNT
ncbi:Integrase core domain-containing protein [Nitrosomonas eutropha]|nr:Integrase core domain-containing protein [Nitrosomonas eutropha]SEJ06113.1 Integrase core domain-containing protein [Nitrosomonas eutropha]